MSSVPDDHQQRHDSPPGAGTPPDPAAVTLAFLRQVYGDQWEILVHLDSAIVSAEHRSADGRAVRYLVAYGKEEEM
jgi:hypothetical protein